MACNFLNHPWRAAYSSQLLALSQHLIWSFTLIFPFEAICLFKKPWG
jgi:hypothetical protein